MHRFAQFFGKLKKYGLHHILFWLSYVVFWVLTGLGSGLSVKDLLINIAAPLTFHAAAAYFNLYVLIPLLLQKKYYVAYSLSLLMTISLVTYPLIFTIYELNRSVASAASVWTVRFFVINAVSVSYTVIITSALKLFFDWYNKESEARKLDALNTETELKYLKSQINPHFLFNSLNNLYSLALKKSDDSPKAIVMLSDILRYLLYESAEKRVLLEKELDYLKNYVEMESLRFGERAKISMTIDGEFNDLEIEPMLLIPFVENAFKHGLGKSNAPGFIDILARLTDDTFFFTVENNVMASNEVYTNKPEGGIGLSNVKKRLEILYSDRFELNQIESGKHYQVQLKLELK